MNICSYVLYDKKFDLSILKLIYLYIIEGVAILSKKAFQEEKMKKRIFVLLMAILMLTTSVLFTSCTKTEDNETGKVYYLNFKPEQDGDWQALAKIYTEKTGVPVTVLTAASGEYESTLTSEITKQNAPTLFQVNGPVGLSNWRDYCLDLSDSDVYKQLTSEEFALKDNGKVLGIAYVIETYGIIYNKTLLNKYFSSDFSSVKKIEDINNFEALKTVAEEIQANKSALGVDGAFTSAGMDGSSDWRFKTHLANVPIYYEYKDRNISTTDAIEGRYLDRYQAIWDLYINNATCAPNQIATKTGDDAVAEFSSRKAVFYQNGTWAAGDVTGNGKLGADEIGMLPIYIGVQGEEDQALCTGSENYWCVNSEASEADRKATMDFLYWVVTSDEGTTALAEDMGFVAPFKAAKQSSNVLVKDANRYIEEGKTPVAWHFSSIPSETWKNGVAAAMTAYAEGRGTWDSVRSAYVNGWKSEYDKINK